jgi:hypothetical protein
VKNEAIGLCRGKYVVEFDHDDELLPRCLEDAAIAFQNERVGFVYMDCCNIYENGNNFKFGDFISYGYGGYYSQKITHNGQDRWVYVYVTPNVNNITSYALIALPNHPRIWRRDVLYSLGSYSEHLPICDDLEILLRTFADPEIGVVKVHTLGYIQYMNDNNNNFSIIRNREINRLGPNHIAPMFYRQYEMHKRFMERDAYEDEANLINHTQLWKRPPSPYYEHKYINKIINTQYAHQVCVLGRNAWTAYQDQLYPLKNNTQYVLLEANIATDELWGWIEYNKLETKHLICYGLQNSNYDELKLYFSRLLQYDVSATILEFQTEP